MRERLSHWQGATTRWVGPTFQRIIIAAWCWLVFAQLLAAYAQTPVDYTVYRTISLVEIVALAIIFPLGVVVYFNTRDCLRDREFLRYSAINGDRMRRANNHVRNERSREYLAIVFLVLVAVAIVTPPAAAAQVRISSVLATDLLISLAFVKAYCSIVDRIERQEDWQRQLDVAAGKTPKRRATDRVLS